MALIESGLRDNGWANTFGGRSRGRDEQDFLKEIYELAREAGWDTLATKKESEHGRQEPEKPAKSDNGSGKGIPLLNS